MASATMYTRISTRRIASLIICRKKRGKRLRPCSSANGGCVDRNAILVSVRFVSERCSACFLFQAAERARGDPGDSHPANSPCRSAEICQPEGHENLA